MSVIQTTNEKINTPKQMSKTFKLFLFTLFTLSNSFIYAQKNAQVIDKIIAVIGDEIVLYSEVELKYNQVLEQGMEANERTYCYVVEEALYEKMLLNQAKLDSVEVDEGQVEAEINRRMRFYIEQLGSIQKFEEFYGKSTQEFKEEFREPIKSQLLIQKVQGSITGDIKITPAEVSSYYRKIPNDSLPYINSQIEVANIVRTPRVNEEDKQKVIDRLNEYRKQIINGERDFETTAILYSQDPGSAPQGGDLGEHGRGTFVPAFEAVAYRLEKDEISKVFESEFGFHIVQLLDRTGERIHVRHILLKAKPNGKDLAEAEEFLKDLSVKIERDSLTFAQAALKYSDDKDTKNNGGFIMNPATGSSKFEADQIDQQLFYTINQMEVGEVSKPAVMQTKNLTKAYRLVKLISRTKPHVANLKDDYSLIQDAALSDKKSKTVDDWMKRVIGSTYIKLDDQYKDCEFNYTWIKPQ